MHEPLASQPFNSWRFTSAVALIKGRDFVTLFLYLNQVLVALLLPVKVGLVQWSRAATSERNENDIRQADDTQNLEGQISTFFGLCGLLVYTSLLCSSVCIACRCSARRTGLKWSPYSLASQAALLQGSDILARFADLDTSGPRALTNGLARWPKQGCIVRLGYWRKQLSQELVHGVRFLHHDSKVARQRSLNGAQMSPEDSTPPEAIISPPRANTFPGLCSEMQDAAINNAVDTRASGPPSPRDQADAIHERYSPPFTRDEERCKVPPIERLWNIWLSDAYLVLLSVLTVAGLVAMGVMVKRGIDTELVYYPKLSSRFGGLAGDMEVNFLLSFLPSMVIDAFFNNIDNVDIYNRTMAPIHNMTKALSDEERARLGLARGTKGATGKRSMLLDYLSPNGVFCIAKAIKAGDYKIAYGTFLATLGRSVFILALPVFLPYWDSTGDRGTISLCSLRNSIPPSPYPLASSSQFGSCDLRGWSAPARSHTLSWTLPALSIRALCSCVQSSRCRRGRTRKRISQHKSHLQVVCTGSVNTMASIERLIWASLGPIRLKHGITTAMR